MSDNANQSVGVNPDANPGPVQTKTTSNDRQNGHPISQLDANGNAGDNDSRPVNGTNFEGSVTAWKDPDLDRIRRKWQLASCAHFLQVFRHVLPLREISVDTVEDLTPSVLEQGIISPSVNKEACLALRDILKALLVVLEESTLKNVDESWFESLSMFVESRPSMFTDCFVSMTRKGSVSGPSNSSVHGLNVPNGNGIGATGGNGTIANGNSNGIGAGFGPLNAKPPSLLRPFNDGMQFLVSVTWNVRLGLLLSLCDIAAEEAPAIRHAVREAELAKPEPVSKVLLANDPGSAYASSGAGAAVAGGSVKAVSTEGIRPVTNGSMNLSGNEMDLAVQTICPLEDRGIRLRPIGRCSRKRSFYNIGKSRIYSGYQHKGSGSLVVECSDSSSMLKLVEALEANKHPRDVQLAHDVRTKFLAPLLQMEERKRRKIERLRQEEAEKQANRRRNAHRPRRQTASYA